MRDFTNMPIDEIIAVVKQARIDNNLTLEEVSGRLVDAGKPIVRSGVHRKENNLGIVDAEYFLAHIKAVGGSLIFEPDASKSDVAFMLRLIDEYKRGEIDVDNVSRKIVQRLK